MKSWHLFEQYFFLYIIYFSYVRSIQNSLIYIEETFFSLELAKIEITVLNTNFLRQNYYVRILPSSTILQMIKTKKLIFV